MKMLSEFVAFLRENKHHIVSRKNVSVEVYDPTYGLRQDSETIEYVDFDALCEAMDEFAETFKGSDHA